MNLFLHFFFPNNCYTFSTFCCGDSSSDKLFLYRPGVCNTCAWHWVRHTPAQHHLLSWSQIFYNVYILHISYSLLYPPTTTIILIIISCSIHVIFIFTSLPVFSVHIISYSYWLLLNFPHVLRIIFTFIYTCSLVSTFYTYHIFHYFSCNSNIIICSIQIIFTFMSLNFHQCRHFVRIIFTLAPSHTHNSTSICILRIHIIYIPTYFSCYATNVSIYGLCI